MGENVQRLVRVAVAAVARKDAAVHTPPFRDLARPPIARGVLPRRRSRPGKRSGTAVVAMMETLSRGLPRCLAAKSTKIGRSTFYRWLRQDQNLRNEILRTERLHDSKRSVYRWEYHPFRGLRPPRPARLRHQPYPAPRFW